MAAPEEVKEQLKRSQQFIHARDRIVAKRDKGEYDDELLSLTQAILEKNADIYAFWNIRRTTIDQRIDANRQIQESSQSTDKEKRVSAQKLENLLAAELFLSYECIKSNPKSYSAWYQRAWVLERQTSPDLANELLICEKALGMDCRNFHCWDHRRIVARMANRTEEEELEFSDKLINHNHSKYSAWQFRSILLKNIRHDAYTGAMKIDHELLAKELDEVKNAFYMDAEDQSAWTHIKWLLEVGNGKEFLRPDSAAPIELITASYHGNETIFVFSRAVTVPFLLTFVDTEDATSWRAISSTSPDPTSSRVWQYLSTCPLRVVTSKSVDDHVTWLELSKEPYINKSILETIYDIHERPPPEYIGELLKDCQHLIGEEPTNKWPLYMRTLVLLEYQPVTAHEEIIVYLKHLAEMDPNSVEVYRDLLSRQNMNFLVREHFERLLDGQMVESKKLGKVEYMTGIFKRSMIRKQFPCKSSVDPPSVRKELIDRLQKPPKNCLDRANQWWNILSPFCSPEQYLRMQRWLVDAHEPYTKTATQEMFLVSVQLLQRVLHLEVKIKMEEYERNEMDEREKEEKKRCEEVREKIAALKKKEANWKSNRLNKLKKKLKNNMSVQWMGLEQQKRDQIIALLNLGKSIEETIKECVSLGFLKCPALQDTDDKTEQNLKGEKTEEIDVKDEENID